MKHKSQNTLQLSYVYFMLCLFRFFTDESEKQKDAKGLQSENRRNEEGNKKQIIALFIYLLLS